MLFLLIHFLFELLRFVFSLYLPRGKVGAGVWGRIQLSGYGIRNGELKKWALKFWEETSVRFNLHSTGSLREGMRQMPWLKVCHFCIRIFTQNQSSFKSTYISNGSSIRGNSATPHQRAQTGNEWSCLSFPTALGTPLFRKMAATKQENTAITLKGSAELVTEFFGNYFSRSVLIHLRYILNICPLSLQVLE